MPVRYAYIYADGYKYAPTDLYYADLDGTWNDDGDEYWGEMDENNSDGIDGVPNVYVGRLPASNPTEAKVLIEKIKSYEQSTFLTDIWFKRALLIGTDPFPAWMYGTKAEGAEGEKLLDYINENFIPPDWAATKLYETYGNLCVAHSIENQINTGYSFANYAGHGNYDGWYWDVSLLGSNWRYGVEHAWTQSNGSNLPVVFAFACSTSCFDGDEECIGESFMLNPDGGAIAYFGATRPAWAVEGGLVRFGLAGELNKIFCEKFFGGERRLGKIWGDMITDYIANNAITYYSEDEDGEGYFDWWDIAIYGCPFMDPTLMIGGAHPPNVPSTPSGSSSGYTATSYSYSTSATDPDGDQVKYNFDWGDGTTSETGFVNSGTPASKSHSWSSPGPYYVKAKATDSHGASSGWSNSRSVIITRLNHPPTAYIDSLTPNPAEQGQAVSFSGHGADPDVGDSITAHNWRSSIDGQLSTSSSFTRSNLSVGTHTIYFKVKDSHNTWSTEVTKTLTINPVNQPPTAIIDSVTPNPAEQGKDIVSFTGHGTDSDGSVVAYNWRSSIDGQLSTSSSFTKPASELSVGTHTIYFKVQDDDGAWSTEDIEELVINPANNPPDEPSNLFPANGASGVDIDADLSWTGGDPDVGDTVTYDVYFGTSEAPPLVSNDQSATTYDPGTLSYNTTYYWRILARDNNGVTKEGPLWDFTTVPSDEDNPPVADGLATILDKLIIVYGFHDEEWTWYSPDLPPEQNTLVTLYTGRGYWINVSGNCNLTYGDNIYHLNEGWNLIGWLGYHQDTHIGDNPDVSTGLSTIAGNLVIAYGYKADEGTEGWTVYNPSIPSQLNTLATLQKGRGYWIKVTQACPLTYGDNTCQLDEGWNLIGWLGW